MRILLSLTNLEIGGAQLFVVYLANEFIRRQHEVVLYIHQPDYIDSSLLSLLDKKVIIVSFCNAPRLRKILWHLNGITQKLFSLYFIEKLNMWVFKNTIHTFRPDIINSQMSYSDWVIARCVKNNKKRNYKFIITSHGEYELGVIKKASALECMESCDALLLVAKKNYDALINLSERAKYLPYRIIPIGFSEDLKPSKHRTKKDLNIPETSFVIGMVARGIPEKGWQEMIAAFDLVYKNFPDTFLILIGQGNYLEKIVQQKNHPNIIRISPKNTMDFLKYLPLFDIGVLPSYFEGESFPNILVQYLFYHIPIIATDIGDIHKIVEHPKGPCGLLIPLKNKKVSVQNIYSAIRHLMENKSLYYLYKKNTSIVKNDYHISMIAQKYLEFYESILRR